MPPPMQKMAVPLTIASLLCHAATMVVLVQTRADLNTVQRAARGSHRHLLESAELDSFVTVAQLDALGARVAAVEQIAANVTATADAWAGRGAEGAARSSSERSHGDARKVERRHDGFPHRLSESSRETAAANFTKGHALAGPIAAAPADRALLETAQLASMRGDIAEMKAVDLLLRTAFHRAIRSTTASCCC